MPIRTHFCEVNVGNSIDDLQYINVPVNLGTQTALYSGRLFQMDSTGKATIGVTTPFNPAYVAYRGIECPDVRGAKAIFAQTGSLVSNASGSGTLVGIMLRPGMIISTTEYHTTGSYALDDPITGVTGSGKFKEAGGDGNNETIGFVKAVGSGVHGVNAPYASKRSLIQIQITRSGYGL